MVGRMSTAEIYLPSPAVSRRHALIIDSGEAIQVLDLDSTNGTFLGSVRVSEITLEPGSVLTVGDCEIQYAADSSRCFPSSSATGCLMTTVSRVIVR